MNIACKEYISIPGIELRLQSAIIQPAVECNNRFFPPVLSSVQAAIRGIGMRATRESSLITEPIERDTCERRSFIFSSARSCAIVWRFRVTRR